MNNELIKYMSNPRSFTLKKWFFEMLGAESGKHNQIIERVATSLTTDKDVTDFSQLVMQIYQSAYYKAVEDYKAQAESLGFKVVIGTEELKKNQD